MNLPQKLKYLRKQMGLSQLELAETLQVSRQAVSGWEAGTSKPSTENLKSLGSLYDVSLEYLLNEDISDLAYENLMPSKREPINDTKNKNRTIVLVLIVVGLAMVVLCAMLFGSRKEKTTSMEEIKGSDIVTVDNFKMNW